MNRLILASLLFVSSGRAQQFQLLHTWANTGQADTDIGPQSSLTQAADGNFYGTTFALVPPTDWPFAETGTVFKMTPQGVVSTMASFHFDQGLNLNGLLQGSDGSFYGTAHGGGDTSGGYRAGRGTIFSVTPDGVVTALFAFNGANGSNPAATLVETSEGFYGVTSSGGLSDNGTIYRITAAGEFTTLVRFNKTNGANPLTGLILGQDGSFYGTTERGGAHGSGTIFKMTAAGNLTTLYSFDLPSARLANPNALIQAEDGTLYGTAQTTGPLGPNAIEGMGTIFRLSTNGMYTELHAFSGSDGSQPNAGLTRGADGKFYGFTLDGGNGGAGTLFSISSDGVFRKLFDCDSRVISSLGYSGNQVPLLLGRDSNLYGLGLTAAREAELFRFVPAPELWVLQAGNSVLISWPASFGGGVLEMAAGIPGLSWQPVSVPPVLLADQQLVTLDISAKAQFFRLRR